LVVNVGDRVFFDYDKSDLSPEARATVEALAAWMNSYPATTIGIEGHCDERGTREYNLALGERRASSVHDYLVALGVAPNRLTTISYGKERPAVLGSNEESWAQNRRDVFVVN
jgi:peptidoglycan-associated lipoprotein